MIDIPDFDVYRIDSYQDVEPFFAWLRATLGSNVPVSLDTETGSFTKLYVPRTAPGHGFCRLWQIGTATGGWAIDARQYHGVVGEAMEMVARAGNKVVFANAKYDMHVFRKEGWTLPPWHRVEDIVVMHRLSRYTKMMHGLKPSAVDEFGEWAGVGQSMLNLYNDEHGTDWETVPTDTPEYFLYGVLDCCLTVMLYEVLLPEQGWWYQVELEYTRLTFNMETRGMLVDMEHLDYAEGVWQSEVDELTLRLQAKGFKNPSSNKAVMLAFEELGVEPWEFSEKTGDPTYNKMVLNTLISYGEPLASAAEDLIAFRRSSKWLAVYGRALRESIYEDDTVHFSISTMEARTGRSSIKKPGPPLQTIPKAWLPRACFVPRRGNKLWAVDYSSQEVRVQASLSEDEAMIAFFQGSDDDYHQYVATLAGIPRDAAKTVNYARAYGAGPEKLARSAGCSVNEMHGYLASIDASFPRAMAWKDEVTEAAEALAVEGEPYVDLGTRRAGLVAGKEFTTAANTHIQGRGSDMLKLAACRVASAGHGDTLVLPVHDELLLELPEGDTETANEIADIMVDHSYKVPMTTDVTGPLASWGDAYKEDK